MKRFSLAALVLTACVSVSAYGGVSVTSDYGVSMYENQFASGPVTCAYDASRWWLNANHWVIFDYQTRARNTDVRFQTTNEYYNDETSPWQVGDKVSVTFTTPTLQVGTVITHQFLWVNAVGSMSYSLTLSGDGTPYTLNGAGLHGQGTVQVNTLDQVGAYDTLRLEIASVQNSPTNGLNGMADFNSIIVLPDRLEQITGVSCNVPNMLDNNTGNFWVNGNNPATLVFTFEDLQRVDAMILWSVDNGNARCIIRVGEGEEAVELARVDATCDTSTYAWMVPLKFDTPLYTDKIYLDFYEFAYNGLHEVMFLTAVPEPATMSLLALGGLAMLRRRARR